MKIKLAKLLSDVTASRRGATAIEYGLIAALISLVVAGGAAAIGGGLAPKMENIANCVKTSTEAACTPA